MVLAFRCGGWDRLGRGGAGSAAGWMVDGDDREKSTRWSMGCHGNVKRCIC